MLISRANNIENASFAVFPSKPNPSFGGQGKNRKFGQRNPGDSPKLSRPAYKDPWPLKATVRRPNTKRSTMKMTYIIFGIILAGGLVFYLTSCGNKSTAYDKQLTTDQDTTKPKVHQTKDNAFEGLRNMAITASPEQLGLSLPTDKTIVYGIIMDWEMGGATASTVAYQTGDASLYLSSGGGVIGGGQHQKVNSAAKQFVSLAQTFLDKTTKAEATPLPSTDEVKFYLLTNKGVFIAQEQMKKFENNSSSWLKLFEEGNILLTELRKTSEK